MSKIVITGGGPAGMIAALSASSADNEVHIFEKNEKLGRKLFITGKGRCNLTNASDMKTVMDSVVSNARFMYSSFSGFDNTAIMKLIEEAGCPLKVERGQRVFPVSDHSSDVIRALGDELKKRNVKVHLHTEVTGLLIEDGICLGIRLRNGTCVKADKVIVATGGLSYPATGSTGDGLAWAKAAGFQVTEPVPSLVPLETAENVSSMMGLSLKNVNVSVYDGKKCLYSELGEMLFTHFGVSGPLILSASAYASRALTERKLKLKIDLKPALDTLKLDARILRDFGTMQNKALKNALGGLLPSGLIAEVIRQSGIEPEKKVNEITRCEREGLVRAMKELEFTLTRTRGFEEAIITQGGVSVREIDPKTMGSRKIRNLFFAGEVLDVDALTGGYNLQIAWSTGYAAGAD